MSSNNVELIGTLDITRSCRAYVDMIEIAEAALNLLEDKDVEKKFTDNQLRKICYNYTFTAMENFVEHIGYALFVDWDSQKNQSHYKVKYIRDSIWSFLNKIKGKALILTYNNATHPDYKDKKFPLLNIFLASPKSQPFIACGFSLSP